MLSNKLNFLSSSIFVRMSVPTDNCLSLTSWSQAPAPLVVLFRLQGKAGAASEREVLDDATKMHPGCYVAAADLEELHIRIPKSGKMYHLVFAVKMQRKKPDEPLKYLLRGSWRSGQTQPSSHLTIHAAICDYLVGVLRVDAKEVSENVRPMTEVEFREAETQCNEKWAARETKQAAKRAEQATKAAAVWAARSEEQKAADHRAAYWAERAAAKQAADWLAYVEALQGAKPDAVLLAGSTLSRTLADLFTGSVADSLIGSLAQRRAGPPAGPLTGSHTESLAVEPAGSSAGSSAGSPTIEPTIEPAGLPTDLPADLP